MEYLILRIRIKKSEFIRIFRFEINVKNCKVGKTNNSNKFFSGTLRPGKEKQTLRLSVLHSDVTI